jgi:N-acetylornithine carbamoyltransferase
MQKKHFLSTQDWGRKAIERVMERADALKKNRISDALRGKTLGMVFMNPSLRTRVSFHAAMSESGGAGIELAPGQGMWNLEHRNGVVMDGGATEHVKDAAKVLSRYVSAIGVRSFAKMENLEEDKSEPVLSAFAKYSDVPVINMESTMGHPAQALADLMTMRETFGKNLKGKKFVLSWAYHPKPLPMAVPNSALLIATMFGMDVTVARPEGYSLDGSVMSAAKKNCEESGGSVQETSELETAVPGASVIYAKSWGAKGFYGKWEEEAKIRAKNREWRITKEIMVSSGGAKFMHCLPIRRNVVADDAVLDGKDCLIYDEAENRLHAQKALLHEILGG